MFCIIRQYLQSLYLFNNIINIKKHRKIRRCFSVFIIFVIFTLFTNNISKAEGALSKTADSFLLKDINIQIVSEKEIKIYLSFNNINLESSLPDVPVINKDDDILKLTFNNTFVKLDQKTIDIDHSVLKNIKISELNNKLDLLLKTTKDVFYNINKLQKKLKQDDNKYLITLTSKDASVINAKSNKLIKSKTNKINQSDKPTITGLDFTLTKDKLAKIIVEFNNDKINMSVDDSNNQNNKIKFLFDNTKLSNKLNTAYDVTDFGTVVNNLSFSESVQKSSKNSSKNIILDINNNVPVDYVAYQLDNKLMIEIKDRFSTLEQDNIFDKKYIGKKISLNFQDIDLRSVLQLIADFTDLNLVASDSVQGNISLRLMNVPWDQALDIILKTKGLDKRQFGNILMIAPGSEIFELEKSEMESKQYLEKLVKLETEYFNLKYAKAEDVFQLVNSGNQGSVLSSRGKISYDKRTNLLIVQDTPNKLAEISTVIKKLDTPVKQVLIEARIVKATSDFKKELGVRWGLSSKGSSRGFKVGVSDTSPNASKVTTTTTATNPTDKIVLPNAKADETASDNGFNVNLGVQNFTSILGLALAKLPGNTLIHLELSALESEGMIETISSPKLITANKVPARIEQGEEIPYQESTSSGATSTSFKKAVLSLTVTPQITPDKKIIMDLNVTNDTKGEVTNGIPAINTQEVETQVLVDNGETLVLGGIFTQELANSVERVPFLGDLPFVGRLFRHNATADKKVEFLVFITPRIVEDNYT